MADTTGSKTPGTTSGAGEPVSTAGKILNQAHDLADQLKDTANERAHSMFDDQKGRVLESTNTLTEALRQTASTLRQKDESALAGYLDQATEKVEELSHAFERKDLDTLLWDVQSFARQNAAIFFGATLAAGFVAARFLKSSSDRHASRMGFNSQAPRFDAEMYRNPGASANPGYRAIAAQPRAGYGSTTGPRPSGSYGTTDSMAAKRPDGSSADKETPLPPFRNEGKV